MYTYPLVVSYSRPSTQMKHVRMFLTMSVIEIDCLFLFNLQNTTHIFVTVPITWYTAAVPLRVQQQQ